MAIPTLLDSYIDETYHRLVQVTGSGAEFADGLGNPIAITASLAPGYLPLTGGTITGDVIVQGTASVAFLNVSIESASVIYSSGSNQFGDATNDIQTLIGTVIVSGSQQITGSLYAPDITGSLYGTASWALNTITSSYSLFATTASYALTSSYSYYSETAGTSQNASDIVLTVLNQSGVQINKGIVVRIVGSDNSSDIPRIGIADWTNDNLSANTLGLALTNIPNGSTGSVMTEGLFKGYDTSTPGWTTGQVVYLGPNGSITGSAPLAPLHGVRLGQVVRVQSNNGSIYVRIDNGYEIGELHDVTDTTTTSSFGDLLVKSGSVWINSKQLTGSYGIVGSLTVTGSITQNASTASFGGLVGIGTARPSQLLHITGSTGSAIFIETPSALNANLYLGSTNNVVRSNSAGVLELASGGSITFYAGIPNPTMRLSTANSQGRLLLISPSATGGFTDNLYRLQVYAQSPDVGGLFVSGSALITNGLTVTGSVDVSGSSVFRDSITLPNEVAILGVGTGGLNFPMLRPQFTGTVTLGGTSPSTPSIRIQGNNHNFFISTTQVAQFTSTTGNLILQSGGTFTDISSARLQINSTSQGFLPPRMTTAQRTAISAPAQGLEVYDTDTQSPQVYNGTNWQPLIGPNSAGTTNITGSVNITGSLTMSSGSQIFGLGNTGTVIPLITPTGQNTVTVGGGTTQVIVRGLPVIFAVGNTSYGQFSSNTGNLILQSGGTFTDGGYKLDVSGSGASGSVRFQNGLVITGSVTVAGGSVTMPDRPAFRVYGSGTINNLSTTTNGDGTLNQNNWALDYQQGSALTGSTGIFTAPIAGLYSVHLNCRNDGNANFSQLAVLKNNSTAGQNVIVMVEFAGNSTMNHTGGSGIAKLAVGDTLRIRVLANTITFDGNDNWSVAYIG